MRRQPVTNTITLTQDDENWENGYEVDDGTNNVAEAEDRVAAEQAANAAAVADEWENPGGENAAEEVTLRGELGGYSALNRRQCGKHGLTDATLYEQGPSQYLSPEGSSLAHTHFLLAEVEVSARSCARSTRTSQNANPLGVTPTRSSSIYNDMRDVWPIFATRKGPKFARIKRRRGVDPANFRCFQERLYQEDEIILHESGPPHRVRLSDLQVDILTRLKFPWASMVLHLSFTLLYASLIVAPPTLISVWVDEFIKVVDPALPLKLWVRTPQASQGAMVKRFKDSSSSRAYMFSSILSTITPSTTLELNNWVVLTSPLMMSYVINAKKSIPTWKWALLVHNESHLEKGWNSTTIHWFYNILSLD
ncbi:hypothetical protein FQN51_000987 [Onygenales sp. PD_10]|nr:hypothetical protein FQN51_000987 [Onygenales sp. PD_10]